VAPHCGKCGSIDIVADPTKPGSDFVVMQCTQEMSGKMMERYIGHSGFNVVGLVDADTTKTRWKKVPGLAGVSEGTSLQTGIPRETPTFSFQHAATGKYLTIQGENAVLAQKEEPTMQENLSFEEKASFIVTVT